MLCSTSRIEIGCRGQLRRRIRRWCQVPEMNNRYLRVILLSDGETIHNVFFDRDFVP